MSVDLRMHPSHERRPSLKRTAGNLLHVFPPPALPASRQNKCEALEADGRACQQILTSGGETWCERHVQDLTDLSTKWAVALVNAKRVEVTSPETAEKKISKLRQAVNLRRCIHGRFYPRGGDTADFIKWITKVEKDVRRLVESILMDNFDRESTPETPRSMNSFPGSPGSETMTALQSPLDFRFAVNQPQRIPEYGTTFILKGFCNDLREDAIRRLYSIVPDLKDFTEPADSQVKKAVQNDGTDIIRSWFRIMVLNESETEFLEYAIGSTSIEEFLSRCQAGLLETYCDFFENPWRPHALRYLRTAICTHALAGSEIGTIALLGGTVPSSTEGLHMTKLCWDALYRWFPTLLTPSTLASICLNFEDYTTICKLLTLGFYNEHWYDPASILAECPTGIHLGFLPSSKGPTTMANGLTRDQDRIVQEQSRNYVCGQMAIADPLTQDFLEELGQRTERLLLIAYKGTDAQPAMRPTDADLFIKRYRSAGFNEDLESSEWFADVTPEDMKNDLLFRNNSTNDSVAVDSWQIIIMDRDVGQPFQLFDIIQDTLLMLMEDPTPRQIVQRVIQDLDPDASDATYLDTLCIDDSVDLRFPAPPEVQYEGHRRRCHDPDRQIVLRHQKKMRSAKCSRDSNRFIRRVVEDMECSGIISLVTEHEKPQTRPVIVQGSDGAFDLYFPYEFGGSSPDPELTSNLSLPPPTCLLDFAQKFKNQNPRGIMAKGSILTHYCAWPMPAIKRLGKKNLNFGTWEGHVYHWDVMPFDRPWSSHAWQYYLNHYINTKFPFVMFYLTTFVICANDVEDAERKAGIVLEETKKQDWRITLPNARDWTRNADELRLDKLFRGVEPM